jgi:plasmid stabilization system protein ParE
VNKYRLTADASKDLIGIWRYIAENSFESADQVVDHLKAAFEMLAGQPGAGRLRTEYAPG